MKEIGITVGLFFLALVLEFLGEILMSWLQAGGKSREKQGRFVVRYRLFVLIGVFMIGMVFSCACLIPAFFANADIQARIMLAVFGFICLCLTAFLVFFVFRPRILVSNESIKVCYRYSRAQTYIYDQIAAAVYVEHLASLDLTFADKRRFKITDDMVGLMQLHETLLMKRPDLFSTEDADVSDQAANTESEITESETDSREF